MHRASIKVKASAYLLALAFLIITAANAATFITNSVSSFNEGTFVQTYYNTTINAVQLSANKTSGNYTSKIFDANRSAQWNSISLATEIADEQILFVIDGQKSVFSSINGSNWITKTANYGGTTELDGLVSTLNNELILLDGKDIYYSSNEGVNWTKTNDQFTPYTNDGLAMLIDSNNLLYIIDGAQRVFKSANLGYNWTETNSDFNGATATDIKGMAADSTNKLFAVDGTGRTYSSSNQGINWTYLSDYGGGTSTDAMTIDQNNYVYILLDKDVYRSTNSGINWTKINDQFTPYTNDGLLLFFNKKDALIIADGNGRIFKSTNSGINWTELGDCNGAASNNPKAGTARPYTINITSLARSCDDSACAGETFSIVSGNLSVSDNRYFQYQIKFQTSNAAYSPKLYNATIQYTILPDTTNPAVQAIMPAPNTNFTISETIEIAANITDNIGVDSVFASIVLPNSSAQQIILTRITATNKYNNSFTIPVLIGQYNITFIANDTTGNTNNTETTYITMINTTPPTIPDTTPPAITPTGCNPTNAEINQPVVCNATITDNIGVDYVYATITLPNTTTRTNTTTNTGNNYTFTFQETTINGTYTITWTANDTNGNTNNTEQMQFNVINSTPTNTTNTTVSDTTPPTVLNITPLAGTNFSLNSIIDITVNITDDIFVDTVFANITNPNNTNNLTELYLYNNQYNNTIELNQNGTYYITIIANDTNGNTNNTETTYFIVLANTTIVNNTNNTNNTNTTNTTISDTTPPTVLNITPLAGTNFSMNSIVDITVNITDDIFVDTVFANITNPDLTMVWIQLFDADNDNIYNNSVVANQAGWYYITIIANDTSGNINNTEKTYFDPASLSGGGGGGGGGVAANSYSGPGRQNRITPAPAAQPAPVTTSQYTETSKKTGEATTQKQTSEESHHSLVQLAPQERSATIISGAVAVPLAEPAARGYGVGIIAIIVFMAIISYLSLKKSKAVNNRKRKRTGIVYLLKKKYIKPARNMWQNNKNRN